MKTEITDMTLIDVLDVCRDLPADELEQIKAFTGAPLDPESLAVNLAATQGPRWAIRAPDGEPLAVAGLQHLAGSTWRTFMLVKSKAWAKRPGEITRQTRELIRRVLEAASNVRLEVVCLARRRQAQNWYEKIGLSYESTLHGYGTSGESAVLFVKVKGARNY